jgi:transcriptional regulator with PAS, ATPase and Fis domain
VLIEGETGTGKDLAARAVHALSTRADKPFHAQNCAALPETLLDGELFGHVRGAFTGASSDRAGLFEAAHGGTVFLDEVGEMTASMQAKLLRVLASGEIRRVGSTKTTFVDVRVVCATHRDLEAMVKAETFRQDLFYRLRTFVIPLPPLRERRADIAAMALHFLDIYAERHKHPVPGFTPEAIAVLESHGWPGNVRELEHAIERMLILAPSGKKIDAPLVRETLGIAANGNGEPKERGLDDALLDYERQLIQAELERSGGVLAKAARALGVDRTTLSKRCKRLGLRTGA